MWLVLSLIVVPAVVVMMREPYEADVVGFDVTLGGEPKWAATPAPSGPTVRLVAGFKPRARDLRVLERHLRDHHPEGASVYRRGDDWVVLALVDEPRGCPFLDADAPRVARLVGGDWSLDVEGMGSVWKVHSSLGREIVRVKPMRPLDPAASRLRTASFVDEDGTELARYEASVEAGDLVLRRERVAGEPSGLPEAVDAAGLAQASVFATRWTVE